MRILLNYIGYIGLFLFSFSSHGQFEQIVSPTNMDLWDITFVNDELGFIVGDGGVIIKTIDGGDNWDIKMIDESINFKKIAFFDNYKGIAIGSHTYMTNDSGETWSQIDVPNTSNYDLEIVNPNIAIISGSPNGIIKTMDRGNNWEVMINNNQNQFGQLSFINEEIGYASPPLGTTTSNLLKTVDSGETWETIDISSTEIYSRIEALEFQDEANGYRGGWYDPYLRKTTDNSLSWNNLINYEIGQDSFLIMDIFVREDLPNVIYVCGFNSSILKSSDNGDSWVQFNVDPQIQEIFHGMFFINDLTGFVIGTSGTILKTVNGGNLGINNHEIETIKVHPNPVDNEILCIKSAKKIENIMLYDSYGKLVYTANISSNEFKFFTDEFFNGLYFLRVITHGNMIIDRKIIINN